MSIMIQPVKGRPTADPKLTYDEKGKPRLYMRLAVNNSRPKRDAEGKEMKDEQGNRVWEDLESDYVNVRVYGKQAERVAETVKKGDLLLVQGRLRTWSSKVVDHKAGDKPLILADGKEAVYTAFDVLASNIDLIRKKGENASASVPSVEDQDVPASAEPTDEGN